MNTRQSTLLTFDDLDGWQDDDHAAVLPILGMQDVKDARAYFEAHFRPVLTMDETPAKFTGYCEPELEGSAGQSAAFPCPLYALPSDRVDLTRAEIEAGGLAGRGLEIAWLSNPVDLFFLQVQGSGRIRLQDGRVLRVGYAGKNTHPYRSVGQDMINLGLMSPTASADEMKAWLKANQDQTQDLLHGNPSYVFFKILTLPPKTGPIGTQGVPITAMRSLAVDPAFIPLGTAVWIETSGLRRLMVAQDTGSAIKGAQRADIFFGTGDDAGKKAGALNHDGRLVVLERAGAA